MPGQTPTLTVTESSTPPEIKAPRQSQENNFNILRVLLAISVIFSHSYPILNGLSSFDPIEHLFRGQRDLPNDHPIDLGHLAVYAFFAISGYLVTMSWQFSHGVVNYFTKRTLRIYPGYIVAVLFCLFVGGPLTPFEPDYWAQLYKAKTHLLVELFVLHYGAFRTQGNSNGSMWTIHYEFICYMIVAALGVLAVKARNMVPMAVKRLLPFALFLGVYLLYSAHCAGHWLGWLGISDVPDLGSAGPMWRHKISAAEKVVCDLVLMSRFLAYFMGGMCLYYYRNIVPYNKALLAVSVIGLAASIWVVPVLAFTIPIFGTYVLFYIAFLPSRWNSFGKKIDLSYGIYLYAFPIQKILVYYFKPHLTPVTLFLAALPITAILALLSWCFVEKPCLKLKSFALRRPAA